MFGVAFVTTQQKIGRCPDNALQNTTKTLERVSKCISNGMREKSDPTDSIIRNIIQL